MTSLKNNVILKYNTNTEKNTNDGKKIYDTNKFIHSLTNIMEDKDFSYMFINYFDSWDNIELFLMFSKVYHSITKQFPNMGKYEKISLVKLIFDSSKTRQLVCNEIIGFRKNQKKYKPLKLLT